MLRLVFILLAACGLAVGPVIGGATQSASAAGGDTLAFTTTSASNQYGQYWFVQLALTSNYSVCYSAFTSTCSTAVKITYTGPASGSFVTGMYGKSASFGVPDPLKPFTVGTYSFSATFSDPSFGDQVSTTTPFKLTITPAVVGIDLRVTTDANHPSNAIVSARLTGDYVAILDGFADSSPPMPAGAWKIAIDDGSGDSALAIDTQQAAGGRPYFSTVWPGVPGGQTYSATGGFVFDAASAANFTVTPAKISYSSPASTASPTPTATAPAIASGGNSSAAVPVWALLLAGLVALLCLVLIVVTTVRARRRPGAAPPPATSDGPVGTPLPPTGAAS